MLDHTTDQCEEALRLLRTIKDRDEVRRRHENAVLGQHRVHHAFAGFHGSGEIARAQPLGGDRGFHLAVVGRGALFFENRDDPPRDVGFRVRMEFACAVQNEQGERWREVFGLGELQNVLQHRGAFLSFFIVWLRELPRTRKGVKTCQEAVILGAGDFRGRPKLSQGDKRQP